jgi:hypothetical protein
MEVMKSHGRLMTSLVRIPADRMYKNTSKTLCEAQIVFKFTGFLPSLRAKKGDRPISNCQNSMLNNLSSFVWQCCIQVAFSGDMG